MKRREARWLLAALALVLGTAGVAMADVVTLSADKDNTAFEEDGTLSNGAGQHLFTGETKGGWRRRAFLSFDVASAVPAGSTISAVTLTLYANRSKSDALTVNLHAVTADWGEAGSAGSGEEGGGGSAATGDLTWTYAFYDTDLWAAPGGEFSASPSASTVVGNANTYYDWTSAQMASDVQGWLDAPATNFGWVLDTVLTNTKPQEAKRFASRQNGDVNRRPELEITFTPPSRTGACCDALGACTVVDHPGASCTGTYQGRGSACSPNPCPAPTGACCLPDALATCQQETETDCGTLGGTFQGAGAACAAGLCPVVPTPFLDPLPVPPVATPTSGTPGAAASYTMTMKQFEQQLHSELPPTTVWGFDDGTHGPLYPGPTLEAGSGAPMSVTWSNDLRDSGSNLLTAHHLPVDTCMHGADDAAPRTVVHLHGGHVAEASDGHPEYTFLPGQSVVYDYPNWQSAGTLWYHDHALGITRLNVYMGLAGFYLLRDATEAALGLPSGPYEIPLVVQDRTFNPDGSLVYPAAWQQHFFGNTVLVNGKVWPYLNVDRGKYRFRMLNGSGSRTYRFSLSDSTPFVQIGTDGGLLGAPVTVSTITLAPGERADVIVDFAGHSPGAEIVLQNDAPIAFPGIPGDGVIPEIMKLVVQSATGHDAAVPGTLATVTPLNEADAVASRDFELKKFPDPCTGGDLWLINGLGWMDITELPNLGTTEIWRFINNSGIMHPMHMHLVFFQVLDRTPFEMVGGVPTATGPAVAPPPEEAGWKDTVQVGPGEMVRVIAHFEDFLGNFAYHCHILEHEDHEMMRQFQTRTTCGDGARGLPDETCDDGDGNNSDSCPDGAGGTCQPAACGDGFVWDTDGGDEQCDDGGESSACFANCTYKGVIFLDGFESGNTSAWSKAVS